MLDKIIIGHDATDRGDDALTLGRLLSCLGQRGAVVAHVYVTATYITAAIYAEWREALRDGADDALTTALGDAADVRKEVIESSSVVRGLQDLAREERADLLVVGSSHRAGVGGSSRVASPRTSCTARRRGHRPRRFPCGRAAD